MIPAVRASEIASPAWILAAAVLFMGLGGCKPGNGQDTRWSLGGDFELYGAGSGSRCYLQRSGDTFDVDGILDGPIDSIGWSDRYVWGWRTGHGESPLSGWMVIDRRLDMTLGPFSTKEFMRRAGDLCNCATPMVMSINQFLSDHDRLVPQDP